MTLNNYSFQSLVLKPGFNLSVYLHFTLQFNPQSPNVKCLKQLFFLMFATIEKHLSQILFRFLASTSGLSRPEQHVFFSLDGFKMLLYILVCILLSVKHMNSPCK